ncbi:MAG: hypothetical protein IKY66_09470 [Bacteroidales bacterium]|nr:hypothetical protein [Bacteroidales bacterium]
MSRKSLILCLSILAFLVVGTGVAVGFLYKGVDSDKGKKTVKVSEQDRYKLLAAIPSDAVLVACFSDKGPFDSRMAVSLHYSGKLLPLYVYDAGKPSETGTPSDAAANLIDSLSRKGMTARFAVAERSMVVASESEVLVQSSLRHIGKSMSVMDAPGFVEATQTVSGSNVVFMSNVHASYLMSAVFTKKYSSYSNFVSRLSEWTAFDIAEASKSFSMDGSVVYDGDASEFMTVLQSSAPSTSALASVVPSYTVFAASLPLGGLDGYVKAYEAFLDSRQMLQKNNANQKSLAGKAGITPYDLMTSIGVKEVAVASFMVDGKLEKVNLIRTNKDIPEVLFKGTEGFSKKSYVPGLHSWPYAGFLSSVFGNMFSLDDESCFTWINGWVVSGSMKAVDEYVSGRALGYTLAQYMSDASHSDMLAERKSSFVSYFSFSEDYKILDNTFKTSFLNLIQPLYADAEFSPMVFSVTPGKSKPSLSLDLLKLTLQKTKAPSFERDTTVVVPKGPFEVKNSGTGKMNKFYQNSHLSLCLSEDGKDLWGIPFKEPLCGTANNVDYFANGKLQIIFGAGSKIYLIDRLGRYVSGFPVDLKKEILLGPALYDFNGTKKYNIMVLHKDNTLEMYNLKGEKPSSWKGINAPETVKSLPERINVGGNSFWVVRTSIQTLIYPFYGGEPLTVFKGDQMIRPDSEIKTVDGTTVECVCYDGKRRTVKLK